MNDWVVKFFEAMVTIMGAAGIEVEMVGPVQRDGSVQPYALSGGKQDGERVATGAIYVVKVWGRRFLLPIIDLDGARVMTKADGSYWAKAVQLVKPGGKDGEGKMTFDVIKVSLGLDDGRYCSIADFNIDVNDSMFGSGGGGKTLGGSPPTD